MQRTPSEHIDQQVAMASDTELPSAHIVTIMPAFGFLLVVTGGGGTALLG